MTYSHSMRSDRPGIALVTVLLVILVCGALAAGAAMMTSNAWIINRYNVNQSRLEAAANAGLAEARAVLNFNPVVYPDSAYSILEDSVAVADAYGNPIPGVWRSTYVGPTGATTGQYGIFGSIVVVANDRAGDRVIRRLQVIQESFAKFAYFTDKEPSNIAFGGGDQIFGPVHTNDELKIYDSGATFHGPVSTAKVVQNADAGTFKQGYTEHAPVIPMPDMADLQKMSNLATDAGMYFNSAPAADARARMRIEFIAVDLNGDGDRTDGNEGFIRVYESSNETWLGAFRPPDYCSDYDWWGNCTSGSGLRNSLNCGDFGSPHDGTFIAAADHNPPATEDWNAGLTGPTARCFLGGDPVFFGGFEANDTQGQWVQRNQPVPDPLDALNRPDERYLFPITRSLNINFKGVIFVDGSVAVSGVVRGHVTLAATGDIIIVDDLTYAIDPGAGKRNCMDDDDANDDVLGLFSGDSIIVADNTINAPTRAIPSGDNYRTYDNSDDSYREHEYIHATLLTLQSFAVESYGSGSNNDEACLSPPSDANGRGCLYLTGGIVQQTRGAVGTGSGTGYVKRYSYDKCVAATPPPYFPTTGHFDRGRYFQVDPAGFNVVDYYERLTSS